MQGRQKIKKKNVILSVILVTTLIVSIDFADGKNGKWKPGIENFRRFPIDKTSQNDGRMTPGKTIPKHSDRTLHNDKRIPTSKVIQNGSGLQIDGNMQNDRRISIDRTLQNDGRISTGKTIQNDRRMHTNRQMENDTLMQYNKRVHSVRTNPTDGIMQEDRRIRINRILGNDRLSENELQRRIDSLTQNKNMQTDEIVLDGRRVLNVRMQNDRKRQNDLKVRNHKMMNASRTRNDNRTAATANPLRYRIARRDNKYTSKNSSVKKINYKNVKKETSMRGSFWNSLLYTLGEVHDWRPSGHNYLITRACHIIATTYISAVGDYKRYYELKYFYQDNIAYEVGYLVSEIVFKYQRMLEIFDMATRYYYKHQEKSYAASAYVLYLYTNIMELGTEITHKCNMLTVIEDKYKFMPVNQSGFEDYEFSKKRSKLSAAEADHEAALALRLAQYEKNLERIKKAARKERKRARNKNLLMNTMPPTPDRRPKVRAWPLVYGWSIEEHLW